MPEVVWATGERRAILFGRQRGPTGAVPRAAVCDGCQRAALHAPEQQVCWLTGELGEMVPEQPRQGRRAWDSSALAFRPVLETPILAAGSFVGPLLANFRPRGTQMEFSPKIIWFSPALGNRVIDRIREHNISSAQPDGLLWAQRTVVKNSEERHQARATGLLTTDGFQQRPGLSRVDDDSAIDGYSVSSREESRS